MSTRARRGDPSSTRLVAALLGGSALSACGGAAPLMHPAHVLAPGEVSVGGGFSGRLPVSSALAGEASELVQEASVSDGLAPWVSARLGLDEDFEVGLTYTGRAARLDARRAFELGGPTLSVGLGASGLLPKRKDELGLRVGGGGADLPVLLGIRSDADLYAGWVGVRGGFELLQGQRDLAGDPLDLGAPVAEEVSAWHVQAGGLAGFRVGFRHVFAAFELEAAMHWAEGEVGAQQASVRQFALSPSGALVGLF